MNVRRMVNKLVLAINLRGRLFGAFTADTLPSRYLRTYAQVERMWPHV